MWHFEYEMARLARFIWFFAQFFLTDSNWRSKQKRSPSIQFAISTWLGSLPSVRKQDKILLRRGAQAAHKARRTFICLQSYLRPLWLHHFATTQRVCGIQVSASCFYRYHTSDSVVLSPFEHLSSVHLDCKQGKALIDWFRPLSNPDCLSAYGCRARSTVDVMENREQLPTVECIWRGTMAATCHTRPRACLMPDLIRYTKQQAMGNSLHQRSRPTVHSVPYVWKQ